MSARKPARAKTTARTKALQTSIVRPGLRLNYGTRNGSTGRVLTLSWTVTVTAPANEDSLRKAVVAMVDKAARERIAGARHTFTLSNGLEWEIGGSGS